MLRSKPSDPQTDKIDGKGVTMLKRILAASAGLLLAAAATLASAQSGVNLGSLTCNVAGGMGFVFGSSKELSCLFNRVDGKAERYTGTIKKFGVDIGFTKESLPPGTEIIVEGYQAKDKSNRAVGKNITFSDGRRLFLGLSSAESDPDKK